MRKSILSLLIFMMLVTSFPTMSSDREGIPVSNWGTSGNLIDFEGWPTTIVNNDTVYVDAQSSGSVEICNTFAKTGSSSLKIDSYDDGYDIVRLNITRMPFNGNYTFWIYLEEKGSETGGCELDWLGGETPDDIGSSRINWLRSDPSADEWRIHNTTGYHTNVGNLSFGEWYNVTSDSNGTVEFDYSSWSEHTIVIDLVDETTERIWLLTSLVTSVLLLILVVLVLKGMFVSLDKSFRRMS